MESKIGPKTQKTTKIPNMTRTWKPQANGNTSWEFITNKIQQMNQIYIENNSQLNKSVRYNWCQGHCQDTLLMKPPLIITSRQFWSIIDSEKGSRAKFLFSFKASSLIRLFLGPDYNSKFYLEEILKSTNYHYLDPVSIILFLRICRSNSSFQRKYFPIF